MRILVVSDIHANFAALSAIDEPHDVCVCLGDLVDYGPEPSACVRWVMENADYAIRGNHDHGVAQGIPVTGEKGYRYLTKVTRPSMWDALGAEERRFLLQLPVTQRAIIGRRRFYFVHATPRDPMDEYVMRDPVLWAKRLQNVEADVVCVGHSHIQFNLQLDGVVVLNPGSVGQPRDGDPRGVRGDRRQPDRVEARELSDRGNCRAGGCLASARARQATPRSQFPVRPASRVGPRGWSLGMMGWQWAVVVASAAALAVSAFYILLPKIVQTLLWLLLRLRYDFEITGLENLPRSGPVLVAANHGTWIDGFLLAAIVPRRGKALVNAGLVSAPVIKQLAQRGDRTRSFQRDRGHSWRDRSGPRGAETGRVHRRLPGRPDQPHRTNESVLTRNRVDGPRL